MADTPNEVLIIGTGASGLLIAQGLRSANIPFRIFEAHAIDRPQRSWGMSLHWGGDFLASVLPPDLRARLREIDTDPHFDMSKEDGFLLCNGETGDTILVMPGKAPRRVNRGRLRALLREGLDIQYEKRLDSIKIHDDGDGVTAYFADGSSAKGLCVLGCDGSRSKVREIVMNDADLSKPLAADCTLLNFHYAYPADISQKLRAKHPVFKGAFHPKLPAFHLVSILDGTNDSDPSTWQHQNIQSWGGPPYASDLTSPAARVRRLKELGAHFADPWKLAAESVADDAVISVDPGTSWDPRPHFTVVDGQSQWNGNPWKGRATLVGDAAHPMLPHRGQGLNNALEDASQIIAALTAALLENSKSLSDAITEYETVMVARAGLEVEVSKRQMVASHDYEMLMKSPMFKHGAHKTKEV